MPSLPVGTPRLSRRGLGGEVVVLLVLGLTSLLVVNADVMIKVGHHEAIVMPIRFESATVLITCLHSPQTHL
jgi:hypothetical protein